ncbi:MAG: hypothetical protein ACLRYE_04730 [Gemmiger formicilis]
MAKLIWGIDPLAVSRLGRTAKKPPFTKRSWRASAFLRTRSPACRRSWRG